MPGSDERGAGRGVATLLVEAVVGASEVVESMHARISPLQRSPGDSALGRTRGITGLVYRTVRGVARASGALLGRLAPARATPPRGVQAALNGVAGDHLARTGNALATRMELRATAAPVTGRIVVLIHGLCMNDRQWLRRGHDHGAALAADLGYTPLYLRYNTGLHVARNGELLADELESLVRGWPVPVEELTLLGHSMGGLVARSACHHGELRAHRWTRRLRAVVCMGTPHEGSPVEVAGQRLHRALAWSSYTAPIARLARVRSAGITDLRHGSVLHDDRPDADRFASAPADPREVRFPAQARCYAMAASLGRRPGDLKDRLFGDQLVRTGSALGLDALRLPAERTWVGYGISHLDLLSDPAAYARLHGWLAEG